MNQVDLSKLKAGDTIVLRCGARSKVEEEDFPEARTPTLWDNNGRYLNPDGRIGFQADIVEIIPNEDDE